MTEGPPEAHGPARTLLVLTGGGALLAAMAIDFLAVIGRHTRLPLLGSIELVQAFVLISASAALVVATLAGSHAVVHLLIERIGPRKRSFLLGANRFFSALFFAAVAAGSLWIAADMWNGHEESELVGIPLAPLRIVSIAGAVAATLLFLRQAFFRRAG